MYAGHLDLTQPLIWTVDDVLDAQECAALIERIETIGLERATIDRAGGAVVRKEIRNNGRVIIDDAPLASRLFERVRAHVPAELLGMTIVGANERLRCYRYQPGEYLGLHHDGSFVRGPTERSLLTFMVYLNDGFDGGETDFPELKRKIVPRRGAGLLFQHMVLHEGCAVTRGTKYAIRSDVLYRASPG